MMPCTRCRSYAINLHAHGREWDPTDADLCDVCYWRKRAESALAPPEGYVVVPVDPTDDEVRSTSEAQQEFFDDNYQSSFFSSGHYMEESIRSALRKVRAARPEVP